jgi:Putative lumazine-binding
MKARGFMKKLVCTLAGVLVITAITSAQTNSNDDSAAIKATAVNYIEGWYEGDAVRMESALHPELAKRMISTDPKTGHSQFNHMGAMQLVQNTRRGGGNKTPKDEQLKEITILDHFNNAAVVKIVASGWIDYLEVAKFNGQWKIINVLWELKPKPPTTEPTAAPQKP